MPLSEVRSKEVNGKSDESGEELSLEWTAKRSLPSGKVLLYPCSCWKRAGFTYTSLASRMDLISLSVLSSSSESHK
jgi:hypothetical protein